MALIVLLLHGSAKSMAPEYSVNPASRGMFFIKRADQVVAEEEETGTSIGRSAPLGDCRVGKPETDDSPHER
jgi:hypothetical protein